VVTTRFPATSCPLPLACQVKSSDVAACCLWFCHSVGKADSEQVRTYVRWVTPLMLSLLLFILLYS
jgi:hypothetical protein